MSFSTALSGLNAASSDLNVKSNNIANVNTTGFKESRAEFGDVFAVSAFGSSSKTAIGSGVVLSNVAQQFNQGNLEFTDNSLDLAISGEGFFAMAPTEDSGEIVYTRAGAFGINKDGFMVNSGGNFLRTFPVNDNGEISATSMSAAKPLQLPAAQGEPEATTELKIATNLPSNAVGISSSSAASGGSNTQVITELDFTAADGTFVVDAAGNNTTITLDGAPFADEAALVAKVQADLDAGTGNYTVTSTGTVVGTDFNLIITDNDSAAGVDISSADAVAIAGGIADSAGSPFVLTGGSNTQVITELDFTAADGTFVVDAAGNNTTITLDGAPFADEAALVAKVQADLDAGTGNYTVTSTGTVVGTDFNLIITDNDSAAGVDISSADAVAIAGGVVDSTGTAVTSVAPSVIAIDPFDLSTYSNSTSATVYDSLGNEHIVTTYYQKVDQAAIAGVDNQWVMAVYVTADDIKNPTSAVGIAPNQLVQLGSATTLQFNDDGSLDSIAPDPIELDFSIAAGTELKSGAADQTITLNLNGSTQNSGTFAVGALTVNGFATGRLTGVDVSQDGLIRATYSNGQAVPIGKIALANFANVQALNKVGNTAWKETSDSGPVIAGEAATGSFGKIQSGALETSNVDLTKELVGLITAQRNFQANSKSIETFNTITQTIINIR